MTVEELKEALKLHSVTHNRMAIAAGARGDYHAVGRCNAIAAMAASGRLMPPRPGEHSMPDLLAAAAEHGLMGEPEEPRMPDLDATLAAILQHGETCGIQQRAETGNGNHGAAQRLDKIAVAAKGGRLPAARPGDAPVPHLYEAAQFHGLIDPDDSLSE